MEDVTAEKDEIMEGADSIIRKEEVSPDVNFVAIKEEPYTVEEDYDGENMYEEEFQFVSCDTEREGPVEGAEDTEKFQKKSCHKQNEKAEDPQKKEQQQITTYDPLYLCEVTFGSESAKSRQHEQAEVTTQSNQTSTAAGTVIKEEVSVEDAEDIQPRTEQEYCARSQIKQETRSSLNSNTFKHNRNLIIPDMLTSCTQCGSAECQCFHVKRKRHRSCKTVKMKFECDICQKVLSSRITLKQHKLTHSDVKNYFCPVCHKTFVQLRQLYEHRLIHTGIKKYQCETCNKAFTQRRTLKRHILIHSDIKRYQCVVCSKAFSQRSSLVQHKFVHSDLKKHKCDVCDKAFSQQRKLSQHKLIHDGIKKYQCNICLKAFTQQPTLSQHRLIHSNVKNHKCDICGKAFTRRDTLLKHRLIHSDVKKKSAAPKESELTQNNLNDCENGVVSDTFCS